ncbi:hypothetical protein BJ166DRAFT_499609 [Pestalotiopsis sp. NC0098]|nr:hypothetical protein BJ166DRAFT_499609 [Pestalotiopsis sp. NC0098]
MPGSPEEMYGPFPYSSLSNGADSARNNQRCIAGGFECQYGTRLSFLEKNAFTVHETSSSPTKAVPPTPTYCKVKFVDDNSGGASSQEPSPATVREPVQNEANASHRNDQDVEPLANISQRPFHENAPHPIDSEQPRSSFDSWSPEILASPGANGGDQIALDALLSLGNEHATAFIDRNVHRNSVSTASFHDPDRSVIYHDPLTNAEEPTFHAPFSPSSAPDPVPEVPEELEFSLMKHYRYEVAPWLDICDLAQPFGMAIPCLATEYPAIFQALLDISARSLKAMTGMEKVLHSSYAVPTDIGVFLPAGNHLLTQGTDMGKALINEIPMAIPSHLPEMTHSQWHKTDEAVHIFQCANTPLFLCLRAMNFCWGDPADRLGLADDMVSTWRDIVDQLNAWYSQRPQEFLSMVEIEMADDGFPLILFTSGAAVFGNQLYHTAMFLLLRHKPRTVMLPSRHRSSTMSTLWHARRICGIALNNDRRECWDMTLVASLLVAARTMTHEAQHHVLLAGLDKVERLTGWGLSVIRDILKAEWGL